MTHLPYIISAYGLTFVVIGWLVIGAWRRLRAARARLAALDPRR
jgi:heme exporter protein D